MTVRSRDRPGIRPEMSAEPAQKTNWTGGRPSEVAPRGAYSLDEYFTTLHQDSNDARWDNEMFLEWDLAREENFKDIPRKIEAMNQEREQNEQQKSQRLPQMRDTPEHKVANSTKDDCHQSESYGEKRDGYEEAFKDRKDQEKEAVPRPPVSATRYRHHPDLQLKGSVPIRGDQAVTSTEAPPPTKSIFSVFANIFESWANLGNLEKDNAQKGLNAHSASTIDQPCDSLGQLPAFLVTEEVSETIVPMILCYAVLWLGFTQPVLAFVIAGTYMAMEVSFLYLRINKFWYIECPALYIGALVLPNFVRYQSFNFMTKHYGPNISTTLVWLVPELTNVMKSISWFWRCNGTKEEPMDQISFQRYCTPVIAYIQGPFPCRPNKDCRSAILHSFDVKSRSCCYAVVWDMLVEIVRHVSFYVAMFSGDSWPSRSMALIFAYFVGSEYCPRPLAVDYARSVDDLIVRACNHTMDSATLIRCPSSSGCLFHQPIGSQCLQLLAKDAVETLGGRPIEDGGFDSLGIPAISLFLVLSFFVPVAMILALSWHWFGPTVTVTFS